MLSMKTHLSRCSSYICNISAAYMRDRCVIVSEDVMNFGPWNVSLKYE